MSNLVQNSLVQLAAQIPVLLVYLAGIILALIFWRRCPTPSLCVLLACALLFLVNVGTPFLFQYLYLIRSQKEWTQEHFGHMVSAVALATAIFRALGFGLLIAGVFLHRKPPQPPAPNSPLQSTDGLRPVT